ncbi:helix-turn-helix domain-containing protein [Variovorax sp. VNK109]|uniref:helix-turn-helix domain-containing protein n=1 Tax=Variovorax sp. VNK109 TaxID=3400919 RepID=UPI003C0E4051
MPNIASAIKEEIGRLARKEIRSETEQLKRASANYRADIAQLKRHIAQLESQLKKLQKAGVRGATPVSTEDDQPSLRFRQEGLSAHRKRLGLSAADFGKLVGVSAQTIYNWEAGESKPRAKQLITLAAVRKMGKREAAAALTGEELEA